MKAFAVERAFEYFLGGWRGKRSTDRMTEISTRKHDGAKCWPFSEPALKDGRNS